MAKRKHTTEQIIRKLREAETTRWFAAATRHRTTGFEAPPTRQAACVQLG